MTQRAQAPTSAHCDTLSSVPRAALLPRGTRARAAARARSRPSAARRRPTCTSRPPERKPECPLKRQGCAGTMNAVDLSYRVAWLCRAVCVCLSVRSFRLVRLGRSPSNSGLRAESLGSAAHGRNSRGDHFASCDTECERDYHLRDAIPCIVMQCDTEARKCGRRNTKPFALAPQLQIS